MRRYRQGAVLETAPSDAGAAGPARPAQRRVPRWLGPTVDSGPLAVFFVVYAGSDLFSATAAMVVATLGALALSLALKRHVPVTALASAAMLLVFGGLTLWLNDADYLKLQSTLISLLFSLALFGAIALRRPLLRGLFGAALPISTAGWDRLTMRSAVFFAALAVLNELVARTQTTEIWVDFNVFGTSALTLLFVAAQWRLVKRHAMPAVAAATTTGD